VTYALDYPTYSAHRRPMGSGIGEAACRLVSNLRVKEPGMRTREAGLQAIPSLRALSPPGASGAATVPGTRAQERTGSHATRHASL
jgi:hypothetical protein